MPVQQPVHTANLSKKLRNPKSPAAVASAAGGGSSHGRLLWDDSSAGIYQSYCSISRTERGAW